MHNFGVIEEQPMEFERPNLASLHFVIQLEDHQEVGHAVVANRTTKGSIGRISAFFAEIKALFGRGDLSLRTSVVQPVFEHPLNSKTKSQTLATCRGGRFL